MKHRFRDRWFTVRFKKMRVHDGLCDSTGSAPRFIDIASHIKEKVLFETLVHESLHACFPDLSEDAVAAGSRDMAGFLEKWYTNEPKRKS